MVPDQFLGFLLGFNGASCSYMIGRNNGKYSLEIALKSSNVNEASSKGGEAKERRLGMERAPVHFSFSSSLRFLLTFSFQISPCITPPQVFYLFCDTKDHYPVKERKKREIDGKKGGTKRFPTFRQNQSYPASGLVS